MQHTSHTQSHTELTHRQPHPARAHTHPYMHTYIHIIARPLLPSGRKRRGRGWEEGKEGGGWAGRGAGRAQTLFSLDLSVVPINPACSPSPSKGSEELGPDGVQSEPGENWKVWNPLGWRRARELRGDPDSALAPPCWWLLPCSSPSQIPSSTCDPSSLRLGVEVGVGWGRGRGRCCFLSLQGE